MPRPTSKSSPSPTPGAEDKADRIRMARERREQRERQVAWEVGRVLWADSPEYKRIVRRQWIFGSLIFVAAIVTLISLALITPEADRNEPQSALVVAFASATVFYGVLAMFWLHRIARRRLFIDRQRLGLANELEDREREIAESGKGLDLATLWAVNQQRIEYYHSIATSQSETSFRNGTVASIAGFVLLLIIGIVGAFSASLPASIAVGIVGLSGAAMSAYIGATFLKTQTEASVQLRQFFHQPVEFARLLGAERLIATLPEGERGAAVQRVIEAIVLPTGGPSSTESR